VKFFVSTLSAKCVSSSTVPAVAWQRPVEYKFKGEGTIDELFGSSPRPKIWEEKNKNQKTKTRKGKGKLPAVLTLFVSIMMRVVDDVDPAVDDVNVDVNGINGIGEAIFVDDLVDDDDSVSPVAASDAASKVVDTGADADNNEIDGLDGVVSVDVGFEVLVIDNDDDGGDDVDDGDGNDDDDDDDDDDEHGAVVGQVVGGTTKRTLI
jgi:hypothetical protein